jgi:hypothetical protein
MTTELREQKTKMSNILGVFHTLSCPGRPHPCSRNHRTGLIVSLLMAAACCPSAMFGQYSTYASVFYVAANGSDDLLVTTSTNGVSWTTSAPLTGQFSAWPPALASFYGEFVLAYVANNGTHDLLVSTSNLVIPVTGGRSSSMSPALTVLGNELVLAYVANDGTHDLLVTTSTNGASWTTSTPVTGQTSPVTPALSVIPNPTSSEEPFTTLNLMMVYISDSGTNHLLVTTSVDGVHWTPNTPIGGQSSRVTPALYVTEVYNQ